MHQGLGVVGAPRGGGASFAAQFSRHGGGVGAGGGGDGIACAYERRIHSKSTPHSEVSRGGHSELYVRTCTTKKVDK